MAGTGIMADICTSPYPSPYPTEKVGDSPYPYPYPVNARIPHQNGDGFGQYPRGRVYLPSLPLRVSGCNPYLESLPSYTNGTPPWTPTNRGHGIMSRPLKRNPRGLT